MNETIERLAAVDAAIASVVAQDDQWSESYEHLAQAAPFLLTTIREQAAEIERLKVALTDCADELSAELAARYREVLYHPAMKQDYENDMATVRAARAALGVG